MQFPVFVVGNTVRCSISSMDVPGGAVPIDVIILTFPTTLFLQTDINATLFLCFLSLNFGLFLDTRYGHYVKLFCTLQIYMGLVIKE